MERIEQQRHVEDVGRILLQTKEELRIMRERIGQDAMPYGSNTSSAATTSVRSSTATATHIAAFQEVLQKAEAELHAKAEVVLDGLVKTSNQPAGNPILPSVYNHTASPDTVSKLERRRSDSLLATHEHDIEYFRNRIPNERTRSREQDVRRRESSKGKIMKKKTSQPRRFLPNVNKIDPTAPAPVIEAEDADAGLLSLINRGFVPPDSDLSLAFNKGGDRLLHQTKPSLYSRQQQSCKAIPHSNAAGVNVTSLKFDLKMLMPPEESGTMSTEVSPDKWREDKSADMLQRSLKRIDISLEDSSTRRTLTNRTKSPLYSSNQSDSGNEGGDERQVGRDAKVVKDKNLQKVKQLRAADDLVGKHTLHKFAIYRGKTMRDTPEYLTFRKGMEDQWGDIEDVIRALEMFLTHYFVPMANIDGKRVANLAAMAKMSFTKEELMACILNDAQVTALIARPGQRYKGKDRRKRAATTLQAFFRMCIHRGRFRRYKLRDESIVIIQTCWKAYHSYVTLKRRLKNIRSKLDIQWESRCQKLRENWSKIQTERRVIVHVPSLSIDEQTRLRMEDFAIKQNMQLPRIGEVGDSNVDIIYITPYELPPDVVHYYSKLLQIRNPGQSSSRRVKFLVPEHTEQFPAHFSLTTILLYSPQCLKRIRTLVKGKEAYLVPGVPGLEDRKLALTLGIPMLGPDPSSVIPLLTRSGAKRLFMKADVNVPVGKYDIYDEADLCLSLTKLIISQLDQDVWYFKLDYDPLDRSMAVVDVSYLHIVQSIRKERRPAEYYREPGARDIAGRAILAELEPSLCRLAKFCFDEDYPDWQTYVDAIKRFGVVIEAAPRTVKGVVRANVLVEPSSNVLLMSTQHAVSNSGQFTPHQRRTIGYAFPQTIIPHEAIQGATSAIAKLLAQDSFIGYLSIDYMVFEDKLKQAPKMWALAIYPFLTNSACSFTAFRLVTQGAVDDTTGFYHLSRAQVEAVVDTVPSTPEPGSMLVRDAVKNLKPHQVSGPPRAYLTIDYISHPGLSTKTYNAFFQTCRLHGVCFDVDHSVGTTFLLTNSLVEGVLGMLCCGETSEQALQYMVLALETLASEVGIPSSGGNFSELLATVRTTAGSKGGKGNRRHRPSKIKN